MSNESTINESYQVHLSVFEGPLDLLLHLIEREKLDISTVSLTQVTDQFLEYIQTSEALPPATLADFLAMAARLVWLKSRLLLPQPARAPEAEEEDPGEELARQLREYKRFKEVSQALQELVAAGRRGFVRVAQAPEFERHLQSTNISLQEFLDAVTRALAARPPEPPVGTIVPPFTLTIHDQIKVIGRLTAGGQSIGFHTVLGQNHNRVEMIVTLLAVLELLKRRRITVEQSALFGQITIAPIPGIGIDVEGEE